MKKLIIIIAFAALYLHFYPNEKLNTWYNQEKANLVTKFSEATDTGIKLRSEKVYTDLEPQFDSFSEEEIVELKNITATRAKVKNFYETYCNSDQESPIFNHINKEKICITIDKYAALL
jgi:hypothetical protein